MIKYNYRVQKKQVRDTVAQLVAIVQNKRQKEKIFMSIVCQYFLNDPRSKEFLLSKNIDEKQFKKILLITPRYENILDTLIAKIEARDENTNEE